MGRHCAVSGCVSDSRYGPPAKFFKFPGEVKRAASREQWLLNVNRLGKDGKLWKPNPKSESVVCHRHFVEHKPTILHPNPVLNMGHDFVKIPKGRRAITRHATKPGRRAGRGKENQPGVTHYEAKPQFPGPRVLSSSDLKQQQTPGALPLSTHPNNCREGTPTAETLSINVDPTAGDGPDVPLHLPTPPEGLVVQQPTSQQLVTPPAGSHPTTNGDTLPSLESDIDNRLLSEILIENDTDLCTDPEVQHLRQLLNECQQRLSESQQDVKQLKVQLQSKSRQLQTQNQRFTYKALEGNDPKTRRFTGFPSYECLINIYEKRIKPKALRLATSHKVGVRPWYKSGYKRKPGPDRPLELIDEFILVMMRLRLGSLMIDLADRFGITERQVSRIISRWVPCLARCLRKFIRVPPLEQVQAYMPKSFKRYPNTRVIIDCTEIFTECPTSVLPRQQTYSSYKSHNTAKILVGITPNGAVAFLSKPYGGRASDKFIVHHSGILDVLEPYDGVMADRGFTIEAALAERCCYLNIPPFTRGKSQLSPGEVEKHRKISSVRIHVERTIERIKNFKIFDGVFPLIQSYQLGDILTICSAIVNMWPSIINDDPENEFVKS